MRSLAGSGWPSSSVSTAAGAWRSRFTSAAGARSHSPRQRTASRVYAPSGVVSPGRMPSRVAISSVSFAAPATAHGPSWHTRITRRPTGSVWNIS